MESKFSDATLRNWAEGPLCSEPWKTLARELLEARQMVREAIEERHYTQSLLSGLGNAQPTFQGLIQQFPWVGILGCAPQEQYKP